MKGKYLVILLLIITFICAFCKYSKNVQVRELFIDDEEVKELFNTGTGTKSELQLYDFPDEVSCENLDETNYNLLSLNFDSNRFKTSFEYMEKSNTIGDESYLSNVTQLELNKSNILSFETNKNVDKNLTDYYNLIYKYKNDCLEASVVYNKQFYNEDAVNSSENIFFKISFVPFGTINTPNLND